MTTRLRQRWLLAVLVAGQFMANVDIAIVNVATPSIHRDLHASGGALEFVVSGYVLAFAMLIITGARLGRIAGYRRVYLAGWPGSPSPRSPAASRPEQGCSSARGSPRAPAPRSWSLRCSPGSR
jgi:MFS family permease